MVDSLRATFGVDYIYCWHGLPAYWSGISLEVHRAPRQHGIPQMAVAMLALCFSARASGL